MGTVMEREAEKNVSKYQRIQDRRNELYKEAKKIINEKSLGIYLADKTRLEKDVEMDCIDHFFECEGYKTYEQIADFAKELGVNRVIDIGCAYGHQSEVFLNEGLAYVGVNESKDNFWNQDKFEYLVNTYPCTLPIQAGDLAISVLCLTWNCYLYDKEETLKQQCEALQRDFEHCLLYIASDKVDFVSRYFQKIQKVKHGIYYFSNRGI